jgi:hypothetical protein
MNLEEYGLSYQVIAGRRQVALQPCEERVLVLSVNLHLNHTYCRVHPSTCTTHNVHPLC